MKRTAAFIRPARRVFGGRTTGVDDEKVTFNGEATGVISGGVVWRSPLGACFKVAPELHQRTSERIGQTALASFSLYFQSNLYIFDC